MVDSLQKAGLGCELYGKYIGCIVYADDVILLSGSVVKRLYAYRLCSPNSPDPNPVDYVIWSVMQERVYQTRVRDIDELRQRLITMWCELEQRIVDDATDQWQRRLLACVDAEGGHFEHSLWAY